MLSHSICEEWKWKGVDINIWVYYVNLYMSTRVGFFVVLYCEELMEMERWHDGKISTH